MEQKDLNERIINNSNDISEIKGKWDSLATKSFVQEAIDNQTDTLGKQIADLRGEVVKGRDWRNRIIGGGIALMLLISTITNIILALR